MIRISTKGRYATRIMVYLAARKDQNPATKFDIARTEGMTPDYVEQLLVKLRTSGLVASRRGVKGGFVLNRDPQLVSVADVLKAAEGPLSLAPCLPGECDRLSQCVTRSVWKKAEDALRNVFESVTLSQLAEEALRKQTSGSDMYTI